MTERSWAKRWTYNLSRWAARLAGVGLCRLRCEGREHLPTSGAALICSNHQSFLDPILIGLGCGRRLNYLARQTLFQSRGFGWLIRWYDAIPLERDGLGLSGMKMTLRRLRDGEMVLIFPEGTRSTSGEIGPLKPGFCTLARRSQVPLVPVAIVGAHRAWPRSQLLPRPAPIWIQFGPPIPVEEITQLDDEALVTRLRDSLLSCQAQAHASYR